MTTLGQTIVTHAVDTCPWLKQHQREVSKILSLRNQIVAETFRPGVVAEMRLAISANCLDRPADLDAGLDRMIERHGGDVAVVGLRKIPVIPLDDSNLVTRIACGYEEEKADEQEKRDRLIILPDRGEMTDEDQADWDRDNCGDRFE